MNQRLLGSGRAFWEQLGPLPSCSLAQFHQHPTDGLVVWRAIEAREPQAVGGAGDGQHLPVADMAAEQDPRAAGCGKLVDQLDVLDEPTGAAGRVLGDCCEVRELAQGAAEIVPDAAGDPPARRRV